MSTIRPGQPYGGHSCPPHVIDMVDMNVHPTWMMRKSIALMVLVVFVLVLAVRYRDRAGQVEPESRATELQLQLPLLSDADYDWIASGIFQNETAGKLENLTYWGAGEDFPSFGIGHFIWFPEGVDAPFDEQFPAMFSYVRQHGPADLQIPEWLQQLLPFKPPWTGKQQFDAARSSPEMASLRKWLEETRQVQARFIVAAFAQRWQNLELPVAQKQHFSGLLQELMETPQGQFAVIDYYNFKGLGNNTRERYQGQGWGLVQVLEAMTGQPVDEKDCRDIVEKFRDAAAARLRLRVELAPPERNEARWLQGWLKRLDAYQVNTTASGNFGACGFRVTPYLQNPGKNAITIIWLSNADRAGQLTVWQSATGNLESGRVFESIPALADALAYHPAEPCQPAGCSLPALPYLHELRITGLEPGSLYRYQVLQGDTKAGGSFSSLDEREKPLRFIVYGDSETEPESTGKHADWPGDDRFTGNRKYPVDQTMGYAGNLKVIQQRQPAFVAIAGDLVESGGEQRDWDEFWLHNAGLAASIVIYPALGNHEYFGGPGEMGNYGLEDSERAIRKYRSYFDLPGDDSIPESHAERYYSVDRGVMTLVVLDTTDGQPHRSDQDTNWRMLGENDGGFAPDWHPGSLQYAWLENELRRAQQTSQFVFVMFHGAPYSSGVHGRKPGEMPGRDILSALPVQALTPLFLRYGVDAVFNGHDEMYEHSVVPGVEISPDGTGRDHLIHFFDIGTGGDGLRGPLKDVLNPYQVFLAHTDAPEMYGEDGVLQDGGKHYGHLEVNIEKDSDGNWQATMDAVYVFPVLEVSGRVVDFERRVYADPVTLTAH